MPYGDEIGEKCPTENGGQRKIEIEVYYAIVSKELLEYKFGYVFHH